jgi:hypothetical protein
MPKIWNPDIEVTSVSPLKDFSLRYSFTTGEEMLYNMLPLLEKGNFRRLRNPKVFDSVSIQDGTVVWGDDIDMAVEELYLNGTPA